ncbi:hypothetical protein N7465_003389 [Penicillium sp. CMV-2018d]|nr:hypothetical protein N7465_003389 [Penicillium sp. CMV-2018d]
MLSKIRSPLNADWGAWKFELLALVGSACSFLVMVVVLAVYNGRSMFDSKNVTLNAIISVLSVAMKASLTFAVAELIGQWKWILFHQNARPLMDFDRIDTASRGPLGSLQVIFRMRGLNWPLRLGALLILLTVGPDPFSQQLLQLEERIQYTQTHSDLYNTPTAYTARAKTYTDGNIMAANTTPSTRPRQECDHGHHATGPANAGSHSERPAHTADKISQQAPVQCPTTICNWNQFQSLGVCHRCHNLSSDLKRVNNFGKVFGMVNDGDGEKYAEKDGLAYVLPNSHFLMNLKGCKMRCTYDSPTIGIAIPKTFYMSSFGTGDPAKTNRMQEINTLIWSMSMIYFDAKRIDYTEFTWPDMPLRAKECALYYCIKTIESKVDDNVIHEKTTQEKDAVRDPDSWGIMLDTLDYAPESIPPPLENTSATLEFNEYYSRVRRNDLVLQFTDNASKPTLHRGLLRLGPAIADLLPDGAVGYNGAASYSESTPAPVEYVWNVDKPDIAGTFSAVATSMTNRLRTSSSDYAVEVVYGRTGTPEKFYKTQWGWIALHGLVLFGGALFWCVTVRGSARSLESSVPVWKNSSLATIRASTAADVLRGAETVAEMEKKARGQCVDFGSNHTQAPR